MAHFNQRFIICKDLKLHIKQICAALFPRSLLFKEYHISYLFCISGISVLELMVVDRLFSNHETV